MEKQYILSSTRLATPLNNAHRSGLFVRPAMPHDDEYHSGSFYLKHKIVNFSPTSLHSYKVYCGLLHLILGTAILCITKPATPLNNAHLSGLFESRPATPLNNAHRSGLFFYG